MEGEFHSTRPAHFPLSGTASIDFGSPVCGNICCSYTGNATRWVSPALTLRSVQRSTLSTFTATVSQPCSILVAVFRCREAAAVCQQSQSYVYTQSAFFTSFHPLCPFALFSYRFPLFFFFLPHIASDLSASPCACSAPSGGSVASDAAGGGQPFVSLPGGNLQAALRQEGH